MEFVFLTESVYGGIHAIAHDHISHTEISKDMHFDILHVWLDQR